MFCITEEALRMRSGRPDHASGRSERDRAGPARALEQSLEWHPVAISWAPDAPQPARGGVGV
eukprot:4178707-Lingulodinium_polyedra.AAC.1